MTLFAVKFSIDEVSPEFGVEDTNTILARANFVDALDLFNRDPQTEAVVMFRREDERASTGGAGDSAALERRALVDELTAARRDAGVLRLADLVGDFLDADAEPAPFDLALLGELRRFMVEHLGFGDFADDFTGAGFVALTMRPGGRMIFSGRNDPSLIGNSSGAVMHLKTTSAAERLTFPCSKWAKA